MLTQNTTSENSVMPLTGELQSVIKRTAFALAANFSFAQKLQKGGLLGLHIMSNT